MLAVAWGPLRLDWRGFPGAWWDLGAKGEVSEKQPEEALGLTQCRSAACCSWRLEVLGLKGKANRLRLDGNETLKSILGQKWCCGNRSATHSSLEPRGEEQAARRCALWLGYGAR